MSEGAALAAAGLVTAVLVNLAFVARWTGQIEQRLDALRQLSEVSFTRFDVEINRLREARHLNDGAIARLEGAIKSIHSALSTLHDGITDS